jgi:chromosome segregation ATPase
MFQGGVAEAAVVSVGVGSGLGFGFFMVRWLATFVAGRLDRKEEHIDTVTRSLIEGLKEEITRLSGECRELRAAVAEHGRELQECRKKHAESEAEVMKLKTMIQTRGEMRDRAQTIIAAEKRKDKE